MENQQVLTESAAAIRTLFGAAACSVARVTDDGGSLRFLASDGAGAEEIVGVELAVGRGIAGWAVMSGQPIAVRDVAADPRFARDVAESTHYVPTSILAAPMFDDEGEAMGVLSVLDPAVDASADWTLAVLGTLASQVALLARAAGGDDGDPRLVQLARRVLAAVDEHRR